MKITIRVFNIIIMALAFIATVFTFASPAFSIYGKVDFDITFVSEMIPENEHSASLHFEDYLGTDHIEIGAGFTIGLDKLGLLLSGNKERIDNEIIVPEIEKDVGILHEPVDLVTDYAIKTILKIELQKQITEKVDEARRRYTEEKTTEEVMNDVGMDDEYFTKFSYDLYNAANTDGATVDSLGDFIFNQIDEALAMADDSRSVDTEDFNEDTRTQARNRMVTILGQIHLLEDDGVTLKKISSIAYIYLSEFLVQQLTGKVEESKLTRGSEETIPDYCDRMIVLFATTNIPDVAYQVMSYVGSGLVACEILCAMIWLLLFTITLVRTLSKKKPWTFFGPWFWILGCVEVLVGVAATVFCKFFLGTMLKTPAPLKSFVIVPRTFALVPSLIFLLMIGVGIAYAVIRIQVKHEITAEQGGR